jgi:hypothetical protein
VPEPTFAASIQSSNSLLITWQPGQTPPDLRRGNWLLDSTFTTPNGKNGYVNAKFYKVMEAISTAPNTLSVDVYPSIQDVTVNQVVVLTSAVEVFERGTGR